MTEEERLDYACGQITALQTFCIALAATHPDLQRLLREFEGGSEITTAKDLASPATDALLRGEDAMRSRLADAVRSLDQARGSPAPDR